MRVSSLLHPLLTLSIAPGRKNGKLATDMFNCLRGERIVVIYTGGKDQTFEVKSGSLCENFHANIYAAVADETSGR